MKREVNEIELVTDYNNGFSLPKICEKYKIGKIRAKEIIVNNNGRIRDCHEKRIHHNFVVSDYHIKKYENTDEYFFIAKYKDDESIQFLDCENKGGHLTDYIRKTLGIEIPSLYDRRIYYQTTGNYWWEQWFNVEKQKKDIKKCPYCNWQTIDVENKSGAFEVHLREKHGITKINYLKEFPEEKNYFTLVNKTLDRQMSNNELEYVTCEICGKKLSRIDSKHLKKHDITKFEYIQKYGYNTVSKKIHNFLSEHINTLNMTMEKTFHSKPELEIKEFLEKYNIKAINNRKILKGKEIDIFINEKNIGIEFNGNKYHTEWYGGKDKKYHLNKTNNCKSKNVGLIQIFEDEYYLKKDIVLNKLKHIIGIEDNKEKIYGRKCVIKEIYSHVAKSFLNKFHIQGEVSSSVYYGAFYKDNLIGVMSFKTLNNGEWELTRFASDYNYICCGVGGKIFKHFIKKHNPNKIKSFADRRWTIDENNNLYIQLGFKFDSYTKPDYKYFNSKIDRYKRFHKFGFRKNILLKKYPDILNEKMTETEMVKKLDYDRIWDCGLIKYVWRNSNNSNN